MRTADQLFNKDKLLQNLMNDEDLVKTVLEAYTNDIPKQLEILTDALLNKDAPQITITAHSIKGASANICAPEIQNIAFKIEKAGEASNFDDVQTNLQSLESEFLKLKSIIETSPPKV